MTDVTPLPQFHPGLSSQWLSALTLMSQWGRNRLQCTALPGTQSPDPDPTSESSTTTPFPSSSFRLAGQEASTS